jgi:DNA invertase Pin-like site-specific DNA recombinase
MTAIGYMRRSKESGPRMQNLEEQAARIRAYCEAQGWGLAELVTEARSWWRQDLIGLADLVRALEANPRAELVVMPGETLAELEAEASETWGRVRAWCEARGVRVVSVDAGKAMKVLHEHP